jgi:hypothetical protein
MPYIKEDRRKNLDECIDVMVKCLKSNVPNDNIKNPWSDSQNRGILNQELLDICGDINYTFSRILGGVMGDVSYPKIAVITGVLENIKQEFYRRVAVPYENQKINENGDIREYKLLKE